jgi:hypothetical protein
MTTHILDVVDLVEAEELADIVLVGHSYAGNAIAAASERVHERMFRDRPLDAFVLADDDNHIAIEDPATGAAILERAVPSVRG